MGDEEPLLKVKMAHLVIGSNNNFLAHRCALERMPNAPSRGFLGIGLIRPMRSTKRVAANPPTELC